MNRVQALSLSTSKDKSLFCSKTEIALKFQSRNIKIKTSIFKSFTMERISFLNAMLAKLHFSVHAT